MSEKPSCSSSASKRSEQLERLRNLHMRRERGENSELPRGGRKRDRKTKTDRRTGRTSRNGRNTSWTEEKKLTRTLQSEGEDYARLKLLNVRADEAERLDRKKKRKNPDFGFSDYEAATVRQYTRLVKQIKPDMEVYERKKEELGEALYPTRDTIIHGLHKDSKEDVDRNRLQDLEKQIDKRNKYSRRRRFNDDEDIDYINERNMKFNKKLERFYGQYTAEIKQNLERGTAV
uniref:Pre-mRNA-splicing factor SYF2 n=1 Tax=Ixodes ricinus TaxID=34613 RepID=V5H519_IXORI